VVKRAIVIAISVILALAVAAPIASGQTTSHRQGPKDLTEAWWTWALADPSPAVGDYGVGDPRCEGEFVEGVFFLAGTFGGDATTRTCTVPAKTALFFPVLNSFITEEEAAYPEGPTNFVDTALANGEFSATLDGEDLKIKRIAARPFTLILPEPNIFGLPGGEYGHPDCADPTRCLTASDGLWVYLPQGLKPGEYTLQFGGTSVTADGDPFSVDVTYNLIVV
jgi:hypothetical protein